MVAIPKHFKEAFPWIAKPTSKIKVASSHTAWLEKEIVRAIFRASDNKDDDFRAPLIKSLGDLKEDAQVNYIRTASKCLAEAVINTPLPSTKRDWLNDVNTAAKKLARLLKSESSKDLPANWSNLFSLVIQLLKHCHTTDNPELLKVSDVLKKANLHGKTKGIPNFVTVLDFVALESKELAGKNAIAYYKYPQTFFAAIANDNKLFLSYQRETIRSIAMVNQEYFGKPYDALTAYILTCLFNKSIIKQSVKKIREKLESKEK